MKSQRVPKEEHSSSLPGGMRRKVKIREWDEGLERQDDNRTRRDGEREGKMKRIMIIEGIEVG